MKVAIFSICKEIPHFETDLELAQKHIQLGDTVSFIQCGPWLKHCLYGFYSKATSKSCCFMCRARIAWGISLLKGKNIRMQFLPVVHCEGDAIPKVFSNSEELAGFYVNNFDIGMAIISTLASKFSKEPKIDTLYHKDYIYDELLTGYSLYRSFYNYLKENKPDLLYVFNGRFTASRAALRACEALNIDFCTHERAGSIYRYILRPNTFPHDYNYVAREMKTFWQKASAERIQLSENWFAERRNAIDQGWYSFVKDQRKGLLPADFSEKNYNIVIFNSTMEEQVGIPGRDPPIYRDELDGLARIAKSLDGTANMKVFIRMHPNLKGCENSQVKEIRKIVNRHSSLISLISPESPISSYELVDKCDLVVSMGSTIGVEACFWGKPVVLACRAYYESLDCCYKPQTHEDLISTILSHPQPKSKESALPYAYWQATHGIPYEHFSPSGIFSGTFNGRNARKLPLYILFIAFIMRLGEIRNFRDLTLTSLRPIQEIAKIFKQKKKKDSKRRMQ